ncbi:MAG: ABC transporter permease, partial [Chloroflexi bacterium]|nr:ABC transporter permease [Chloroflexota bacterium]
MNARYIVGRLLQALLVVIGVSFIVFIVSRLSGDPAVLMAAPGTTERDLQALRERLGLDQPLVLQYLRFLAGVAVGDFGISIWQNQPALGLVLERMPYTILLTCTALAFALAVAFPAGIVSALARRTWWDQLVMLIALVGQAVPVFWLGLMLILVFAENLLWLPSSGSGTWRHLILPSITLGAFSMARTARLVRSGMLEVLGQDYIRTARAKGLTRGGVVLRHALKN